MNKEGTFDSCGYSAEMTICASELLQHGILHHNDKVQLCGEAPAIFFHMLVVKDCTFRLQTKDG